MVSTDPTIKPPGPSDLVFKDECLFSFQTPDLEGGLNVCLHCFQGFAPFNPKNETNYTFAHYSLSGHFMYLNITKIFQPELQEEHLKKKLKLEKIQVIEDDEENMDFYLKKFKLIDLSCESELELKLDSSNNVISTDKDIPENCKLTIQGILNSTSFNKKSTIDSWELEIKPCSHATSLQQEIPPDYTLSNHCSSCELLENLWICLTCGNLGCGRQQFGGLKGNSHSLLHFESTQHPIAVKLGSLSLQKQKADVYCYIHDEEIMIPQLSSLLKPLGIDISSFVEKNEKTLTELNLQQNLTWQFNMESDSGELYTPIYGKELTGLKNLGNSCYINSNIQMIFHLPVFKELFFGKDMMNLEDGLDKPYDDLYIQLIRLMNGLCSGDYSVPDKRCTDSMKWQRGLSLNILKNLIGKTNEDFKSMNQQDAFEFLLYFLDKTEEYFYKYHKKYEFSGALKFNPIDYFKFVSYEKFSTSTKDESDLKKNLFKIHSNLEKFLSLSIPDNELEEEGESNCGVQDFNELLDLHFSDQRDSIEIGGRDFKNHKTSLISLPEVLVIQVQRAKLKNWVPIKLNTKIKLPNESINLSKYRISKSELQADKESPDLIQDDDDDDKRDEGFKPNQDVMNNLLQMGFPEIRATKALYHTGNSQDSEIAMNWLFQHMEDPDIDDPFVPELRSSSSEQNKNDVNFVANEQDILNLTSMGFDYNLSRKALFVTGNPEAAVEWLFNNPEDDGIISVATSNEKPPSMKEQVDFILEKQSEKEHLADDEYALKAVVCHKGKTIHTGHYVVYIKQTIPTSCDESEQWVLYNDEKVVLVGNNDEKSRQEMENSGYLYLFVKK